MSKNETVALQHAIDNPNGLEFSALSQTYHCSLLPHLSVLQVSGTDAAHFLQGQCTCDMKQVGEQNAVFGAFCTVKGRVITTFMIISKAGAYWLVMPTELVATIKTRLTKFILRAKVVLTDCTSTHTATGVILDTKAGEPLRLPQDFDQHNALVFSYPALDQPRFLILAEHLETNKLQKTTHYSQNNSHWIITDIRLRIPWLSTSTTEEYIPQMLNLDQLGGISFNKGCYTGQEVVARTHYLGKSKRRLYVAKMEQNSPPGLNSSVFDTTTQQVVGHILNSAIELNHFFLLLVLNTEIADQPDINLSLAEGAAIKLV